MNNYINNIKELNKNKYNLRTVQKLTNYKKTENGLYRIKLINELSYHNF